jgi:capsular polysaccharide export protein
LDNSYTKVFIWNGGKFRERIAIEVAKILNIQVYYFENGLLPNTIVFDAKGINYNNSVPREKSFYENYHASTVLPQNLIPRIGKGREIFKGVQKALPPEYIFVPFQVDSDTQILMQSPWIKDMRMLFATIERLTNVCNYHFVLKEHPSSGVKYPDLYPKAKENTQIHFHNSHSTQALIQNSVAVITINSTIGIESLLFHKKVIVLGDAFYAIEGISQRAKDFEALLKIVKIFKNETLDTNLVNNFLKYLYNAYLIHKDEHYEKEICKRLLNES